MGKKTVGVLLLGAHSLMTHIKNYISYPLPNSLRPQYSLNLQHLEYLRHNFDIVITNQFLQMNNYVVI